MNVGPPPKPNLFLLWINSHKFHYFGIMKTYSFLYLKKILKTVILENYLMMVFQKIKFGILKFRKTIWELYFF